MLKVWVCVFLQHFCYFSVTCCGELTDIVSVSCVGLLKEATLTDWFATHLDHLPCHVCFFRAG